MTSPEPGRELIADSTWSWSLYRLEDGSLVLSVVCGTVGIYEIDVTLGPETTAAYNRDGLDVIEKLAAEVRYSPHKWSGAPVAP